MIEGAGVLIFDTGLARGLRIHRAYVHREEDCGMEIRIKHVNKVGLAFMGSVFWLAASASAQSTPAQSTPAQGDDRNMGDRDRDDATRRELSRFDQFLDGHREISEQLRKDPSLANNPQFLKSHPALQSYLQEHPGISGQLRNDPNQFMKQEVQYDRREDNWEARRQELARFDQFLDSHREVAEQLRKNPLLANDHTFPKEPSGVRDVLAATPNGERRPGAESECAATGRGALRAARIERSDRGTEQRPRHGTV